MLGFLSLSRHANVDHIDRIDTPSHWHAISVRHGYNTTARTESAKFVIDQHQGDRIYFFNSKKWETHYEFVLRHINPLTVHDHFLIHEYDHDDRRYLLGSILHYLDGDHWTLELTCGDSMKAPQIARLHQLIAARVALTSDLRFRPSSPSQIEIAESFDGKVPVLSRDAINASIEYQPVVVGEAYGYLRIVRGRLDVSSVRPYDVVVIDHVPDEIPPVAALVTSELQAPLAHVAVLSRNRNTPDMALRGAADRALFTGLEGELVKLTVAGQDYTVERATLPDAEAAWARMRPEATFVPERELDTSELFNIDALPKDAVRCVGAKSAQLGDLSRVDGIETPGGFALPFSTYVQHVRSAGLDGEIDTMLADPDFAASATVRAERLKRLRERISSHPVEPSLLAAIDGKLRALGTTGRFILRSSTNAEDLAGFNGAGLYESIAVPPSPTQAQIADALRFVWASVWLQRAYEEREWYRIDHRAVAMGVLVQPFVEQAVATGVAITGNPFKPGSGRSAFINVQVAGTTVTGAVGNELPEQYLILAPLDQYVIDQLSRSSLTQGRSILAEPQVMALTEQLMRIHDVLLPEHAGSANAMDVEFVLVEDGRFVIVQARPYTIVYSLDRARAKLEESGGERLMRRVRKLTYLISPRRIAERLRA